MSIKLAAGALLLLALACDRRPCSDAGTEETFDRRIASGVPVPAGANDRLVLSRYGDVCRYVGASETDGTWDQVGAYWLQPTPGAPEELSYAQYDLVFHWPDSTWRGTATSTFCPDGPAGYCLRFVGAADGVIDLFERQ